MMETKELTHNTTLDSVTFGDLIYFQQEKKHTSMKSQRSDA